VPDRAVSAAYTSTNRLPARSDRGPRRNDTLMQTDILRLFFDSAHLPAAGHDSPMCGARDPLRNCSRAPSATSFDPDTAATRARAPCRVMSLGARSDALL
jgi:hypothetical protein